MGVGVAVVIFGLVFALGDFSPSGRYIIRFPCLASFSSTVVGSFFLKLSIV